MISSISMVFNYLMRFMGILLIGFFMVIYYFNVYSFIYDTLLLYYLVYSNKLLISILMLIGLIEGK